MLLKFKDLIKNALNFVNSLIFRLAILISKSKDKKQKYYFSICAIFKNEGIYFPEWIEYHKLIGVDHIYLYNNFSTDNYLNILKKYLTEKFITLIEWPIDRGQISAYEDCFNKYRTETKWIMFLDLDEFICPKYETDIKKWICRYEKYPSVIIYWLMFGTNGKIEFEPDTFVIEQYTCCWESIRNVGKVVLNTDFIPDKIYHHHIFCIKNIMGINFKIPMINEKKKFIFNSGKEKCPQNSAIQINHYWSKCLQEYIRKIDKGDIFSLENEKIRKEMDFFYWHEYQNISQDKTIWRFLIDLKIKMNSINIKFK